MKQTLYPKKYATITRILSHQEFVCQTDDGSEYVVPIRNRRGRGSTTQARPGVRIKVFWREIDRRIQYSFIGG